MELLNQAKEIVLKDLRSCYRDRGILASNVNFTDYWARDSFWASLGLLESNIDIEKVKSSLELFLNYQKADGKIPRKTPRPIYTSSIKFFVSLDDNLLFVIAFCKYIEKTNNQEFLKQNIDKVYQALKYYADKKILKNNLLYETGFANWMDTVFKKGAVLYTNSLWFKAIKCFENLKEKLSFQNKFENLPESSTILTHIQESFWLKEGYFADNVSSSQKTTKYFDLAGNVLTILFDIANENQAKRIFEKIKQNKKELNNNQAILNPLNYPRFPFWKISPVCFLLNIQDYQNQISWSWIEALLTAAYAKYNEKEKAKTTLENLSSLIVQHGHIHETYYLDGKPFDHLLWKSAVPFAWGAGLFLYAADKYQLAIHQSADFELLI